MQFEQIMISLMAFIFRKWEREFNVVNLLDKTQQQQKTPHDVSTKTNDIQSYVFFLDGKCKIQLANVNANYVKEFFVPSSPKTKNFKDIMFFLSRCVWILSFFFHLRVFFHSVVVVVAIQRLGAVRTWKFWLIQLKIFMNVSHC